MERILILIGLIFSTSIMGNEKQLYILGGGGEPVGDETIFDSSLKDLSNFVKSSDWKTTISFNGGHSKTEKIIKNNFKKGINGGDFVKLNYDVILKDIEDKLLKGSKYSGPAIT